MPGRISLVLVLVLGCFTLSAQSAVKASVAWKLLGPSHLNLAAAIDYSTPGGLYAGRDRNLYHSIDRGKTWTQIGIPATQIVTLPKYPKKAVVLTEGMVYISDDAGQNWERHTLPKASLQQVFAVDQERPNRMYLGEGQDVYSTEDSGQNWIRHQVLSSGTHFRISSIAVSQVDGAVYVGRNEPGLFHIVAVRPTSHTEASTTLATYRSNNMGVTWKTMPQSHDMLLHQDYVSFLAADPKDARIVYAGGMAGLRNSSFLKSMDGGVSWSFWEDSPIRAWVHSIVVDPSDTRRIYVGTFSDGVYVSIDGGEHWTKTSEGLPTMHSSARILPVTLVIDEQEPRRLYAVTSEGLYERTY